MSAFALIMLSRLSGIPVLLPIGTGTFVGIPGLDLEDDPEYSLEELEDAANTSDQDSCIVSNLGIIIIAADTVADVKIPAHLSATVASALTIPKILRKYDMLPKTAML